MKLRTDDRNIVIDGDHTETLVRLDADKKAVGGFGLSFYQNNTDKLRVAIMCGVVPSSKTLATGEYLLSRPLYFYAKQAHIGVIPGLKEYIEFFVSNDMAGPDGPLAVFGVLSDPDPAATQEMGAAEPPMAPPKKARTGRGLRALPSLPAAGVATVPLAHAGWAMSVLMILAATLVLPSLSIFCPASACWPRPGAIPGFCIPCPANMAGTEPVPS